jgi:acyl-CoA thioester hydrolase
VYYQDTDAGGVVFHGTYLDYFERARTEWLRRLGFDLRRMAEHDHMLFIVRELRAAYARPALLDDLLSVTVGVEHIGRAQFTLGQQVLRGEELLVQASVNLACVDSVGFRPVRVPEPLLDTLGNPHPTAAAEEQA